MKKTFATKNQVDELEKKINTDSSTMTQRIAALEGAVQNKQSNPETLSFDDCVLDHIKDATSDVAAVSIKQSCLSKVSVLVDLSNFQSSTATYGKFFPMNQGYGLRVLLNNESPYTLTSIGFDIQEKSSGKHHYYTLNWFGDPDIMYSEMKDDTSLRMLTPGQHYIGFEVSESSAEPKNFFKEYIWNVAYAKGFIR